jgi:UDP-sugar transporter A1/2/3
VLGGSSSSSTTPRKAGSSASSFRSAASSGKALPDGSAAAGPGSSPEGSKIIKYGALFLLVAQMVGLVLLMRYSRTQPRGGDGGGGPLYLASTAVFAMEATKLALCFLVIGWQARGAGGGLVSELRAHVLRSPAEVAKLCVPSLLYTVQNNLLYLALTNLDAATYQVCYQLKILTTALFSALLLGRRFSRLKWLSLVLLTAGVAVVQLSGSGDGSHPAHHHDNDAAAADHRQHVAGQQQQQEQERHLGGGGEEGASGGASGDAQSRLVGLAAVLCAACTSGFAGVWFEKILKGSRTSLWVRNVQMGLPSTAIALLTVWAKDAAAVRSAGFFQGYNGVVWTVVAVQAVGGLVVAVVVKYADNVLKVFATSFSIVVSCVISALFFDFRPNLEFVAGAGLVVGATVLYSAPERPGRTRARRASSRATALLPLTAPMSKAPRK